MSTIEQEIQQRASVAPRVTPADIEAAIAAEYYTTADRAFRDTPVLQGMKLLTLCVLVLKNGFTITGTSACASPENFDADIGRKVARADAVRQAWPLLGYALRDRLAATPTDFRDRVRVEAKDLATNLAKLSLFVGSDTFMTLPATEQSRLLRQRNHMASHLEVLNERIAAFDAPAEPVLQHTENADH